MASGEYTDGNYNVRRYLTLGAAGGGATTAYVSFAPPDDIIVSNMSAIVRTAGTTTGAAFTIRNGTTSIGSLTVGTSVANTVFNISDLNAEVSKTEYLNVLSSADATAVAAFTASVRTKSGADYS